MTKSGSNGISGGGTSRLDLIGTSGGEFCLGNVGGRWATALVLLFLTFWKLSMLLLRLPKSKLKPQYQTPSSSIAVSPQISSIVISDADLRDLIHDLQGNLPDSETWEHVVDKNTPLVSYKAKCYRLKDGSLKYLSITTFEKCSTELLRDFYMDTEYRIKWDKTVVDHQQLEIDEVNAFEVGRTIKKFPFLTPREYVLAWRLWQGKDMNFYCLIKDCEHPMAPRQKKYVRVGFFRSGWCIRRVPGRDACEIMMVHQEDAGLNVEMAKIAFAKGIWNYVCKMNTALRKYSSWISGQSKPVSTPRHVQVPAGLESETEASGGSVSEPSENGITGWQELSPARPSKKWIAKGLLLLGGVVCLSRGHSGLATQLAMACFLKKLTRHGDDSPVESEESNQRGSSRQASRSGRWTSRQRSWSQKGDHSGLLSPRHPGASTM